MTQKGFSGGFFLFFKGLALVFQRPFRRYMILPAFISLLLWAGIVWGVVITLFSLSATWIDPLLGQLSQMVASVLGYILKFVWIALALFLGMIAFRLLAGIALIPFLGPLLEALETEILGAPRTSTFSADFRNALVGARVGFVTGILSLLVWAISIPLGPLQLLILMPLESYFFSSSIFDLLLEKESADTKERKQIRAPYRRELLGIGLAAWMVLWIPVAGPILAPPGALAALAFLYYGKR